MSEEVDRRLYAHYKELTEGKRKTGNPVRDNLIVSDAKRHLADLVDKTKKHSPNFDFEDSGEEEEVKENIPKSKPKTKKISKED